ncbi:molybdate ABC transporter permease subunit [Paenibacillus sp. 1001270B_150601_E10]|uniref:molybdate ABC transporter permease subunit n=1 Tax=Paenibacillus sp. 1001270B_150601_E10 TaxID=2787079 RepID=UPI00189E8BC0|nr:molybdate ABC transporter permease subunit [Paenibacillus sp. 1001270B_150601_E10]
MNGAGLDGATFWQPIFLSLQVAAVSSVLATTMGIAVAWWMNNKRFRGKVWLETLFMLPLVLPPTVIGFLLLIMLGKHSFIGQAIEFLFSTTLIFSWWSAVIAAIVVSFPLSYQTMKTGFSSIDADLLSAARSIGANEMQLFYYVALPLAWRSFLTAFILSFARSLGEFGATIMIAGNIPGKTQTISTAIYVAVDSGNTTLAWMWTLSIIVISFLLLLFTRQSAR